MVLCSMYDNNACKGDFVLDGMVSMLSSKNRQSTVYSGLSAFKLLRCKIKETDRKSNWSQS